MLPSFLYAAAATTIAVAQDGVVRVLDLNGNFVAIPVYARQGLGDIARGGNGAVLVDPIVIEMPYAFQQFLFAHEAAHVIGIFDETAADCYAGRMLRVAGFTHYQLQAALNGVLNVASPYGDSTHLPSGARTQVVLTCYAQ